MVFELANYPIAPLLIVLVLPLAHALTVNRKGLRPVLSIVLCSVLVVLAYPLVTYSSSAIPLYGYALGKLVLFVLFPVAAVSVTEGWSVRKVFYRLGVRKENLGASIFYGVVAAVATIAITTFVSATYPFDLLGRTVMFFEAFTEEFFFRGFLFLYLIKKTGTRIAYITSILGFVLVHPQHYASPFLISTAVQSILLTVVAHRTGNVIGPWVSHGLNRFMPVLVRGILGL